MHYFGYQTSSQIRCLFHFATQRLVWDVISSKQQLASFAGEKNPKVSYLQDVSFAVRSMPANIGLKAWIHTV